VKSFGFWLASIAHLLNRVNITLLTFFTRRFLKTDFSDTSCFAASFQSGQSLVIRSLIHWYLLWFIFLNNSPRSSLTVACECKITEHFQRDLKYFQVGCSTSVWRSLVSTFLACYVRKKENQNKTDRQKNKRLNSYFRKRYKPGWSNLRSWCNRRRVPHSFLYAKMYLLSLW